MDYLSKLENQTIYIIREAFAKFKNVALLWSIGKDSTTLLWLIRKSFFGAIPHPVIHIDTGFKFKEIYEFRDRFAKKWNLDLIIAKNYLALEEGISPDQDRFRCCNELKTNALKNVLSCYNFKALYLAIRRDEHGIRSKERVFSPRDKNFIWDYMNQPPELWEHHSIKVDEEDHVRIHPMLAWREIDIWRYIKREQIPAVPLYFAKGGLRYRSIGCSCCCDPVESNAKTINDIIKELELNKVSERSGRIQDKEQDYMMQKLRSLGYM